MKMINNLLATLFCIITLGIIDVEIKYSDGTKFKYISWIHIFYKKDYEKVVRCKDCKCYLAVTYNGEPMHYGYCKNKHDDILGNRHRFEGDYCSYGERKSKNDFKE